MHVKITSSTDLINGGCNACPTVKTTSYTLTHNELSTPLEELDVSSLVMALVLMHGYRQELVIDFMDEYLAFTKDGRTVQLLEEYELLNYRSHNAEIIAKNNYADQAELFAKVNQILGEVFGIAAVEFVSE